MVGMFKFLLVLLGYIILVDGDMIRSSLDKRKKHTNEGLNEWPIIGIFTQTSWDDDAACNGECEYLAGSYVQYIESAGARVVPISMFSTNDELDHLLSSVNGILFPGGGAPFPAAAKYVFDKVKEMNDAGDFFPLWGTCMGFQWLLICASDDENILDPSDGTQMDAYNISLSLDYTLKAKSSKFFANQFISSELVSIYGNDNVTMNNHHYGIWTDHFYETESLTSFYDVLSTNKDRNGDEFVSTIEAKHYPITGTQWHPEKNTFEWKRDEDGTPNEAINHSPAALLAGYYPAKYFVAQARHNMHIFASVEEEFNSLIYNYQPTYVASHSSFEQKYYFPTHFQPKSTVEVKNKN
jgi:gamma-glutamyl hydrolase